MTRLFNTPTEDHEDDDGRLGALLPTAPQFVGRPVRWLDGEVGATAIETPSPTALMLANMREKYGRIPQFSQSGTPRIRWLGQKGTTERPVGVGVIDPTGKPWNNTTYQACVGVAIKECGQLFSGPGQEQQLQDCIDSAQAKCIEKAKAAMNAPAMSSAQVMALQTKINNALKQYDYCPIGVDGTLGPETCGAAIWAVAVDPSIVVPGYCNTVKPSFQLKDCPSTKPAPAPAPGPVPGPVVEPPPVTSTAPKKSSKGWLLLAAGAAGALFLALKAPPVPPREADRNR